MTSVGARTISMQSATAFIFALFVIGVIGQPGYGGDAQSIAPEANITSSFESGCKVGIMIGSGWSKDNTGDEYFVVYLEFSSSEPISTSEPWAIVVESPAYIGLDSYWNVQVKEFHDGYIEGVVNGTWGHDVSGEAQIVDVGLIIHSNAANHDDVGQDGNWKFPQFVSANGQACELHEIV